MVRIYANLAGLSKTLSKVKLAGPEKRSLAPFAARFNRSNDLFDFVDAGELKENADFKIRAMFRQFAENPQCRHIYFAGCHDVGYISELTPYTGSRDKITLVRTPAFHPEFNNLGMRVEDFPNVFRTVPLDVTTPTTSIKSAASQITKPPTAPAADGSNICTFYQNDSCKYGKGCRCMHLKANANGNSHPSANAGSLSDIKSWRQSSVDDRSKLPFSMPTLTRNDNGFMTGNTGNVGAVQAQIDFATSLPKAEEIPRNEIAVNKYQHRLDAYIPPPSPEDRANFHARIAIQKLCNNHHINGNCPHGDSCGYDHRRASADIVNCLKQVASNNPCPRKGTCRVLSCLNGHICQKAECQYRGGKLFCKLPAHTHTQDMNFYEFVPDGAPRYSIDEVDTTGSTSSKGSTPPIAETRSLQDDSDGEVEGGEGALLDLGDDGFAHYD